METLIVSFKFPGENRLSSSPKKLRTAKSKSNDEVDAQPDKAHTQKISGSARPTLINGRNPRTNKLLN